MKNVLIVILGLFAAISVNAQNMCDDSSRQGVCLKMRHLRASINWLDAQRELMQVNKDFFASSGYVLSVTAKQALVEYGIGLPEHLQGLSGVERLGAQLTNQAMRSDVEMLKTANTIRNQCATCHASRNSSGDVKWDQIFDYDWNDIAQHCNESNRNPYLCRSMNGMLSAYGYLITAYEAKMTNFAMTRKSADEIVRILVDLKERGFYHLPEDLRARAEAEAREIGKLADAQDPAVFERATKITNACQTCHSQTGNGPSNVRPLRFNTFSIVKKS